MNARNSNNNKKQNKTEDLQSALGDLAEDSADHFQALHKQPFGQKDKFLWVY